MNDSATIFGSLAHIDTRTHTCIYTIYIYLSRTQQRYQYISYLPYAINYKVDRIIYEYRQRYHIQTYVKGQKKLGRTFY